MATGILVANELTRVEQRRRAVCAVRAIIDVLWPDGDGEREWKSCEVDEVAHALRVNGFGPDSLPSL